ncbi:hypothetical protein FOA52_015750 [Chlamydomonas sp. UWO 241]|nr:hypothetical protein FOA52_015750 [Chlamydomonas sp. UWO 241]
MRQRAPDNVFRMDPTVYSRASTSKKTPWLQALIQSHWTKTILIAVVVTGVLLVALLNLEHTAVHPAEGQFKHPGPKYELIAGAEVVWEKPSNPKGVLFVAHGCNHGAVDFWHSSRDCPSCTGLPEEMNITRAALSRGYAVVAISSQDRTDSRCWSLPGMESDMGDIDVVQKALQRLLKRERLANLPLYAFGASSGGGFVLALAAVFPFDAICSQIMGLPAPFMAVLLTDETLLEYPPTLLVHMPRDTHTHKLVKETMMAVHKSGVKVAEIQVPPQPMTPTTLSDIIPTTDLSSDQSAKIFEALSAAGLLDAAGMLTQDPRQTQWRKVLKDADVPGFTSLRLKSDLSPISEVLNRLYAQHEITSATTTDMLDWFESPSVGYVKDGSEAAAEVASEAA